MGAVAEEKQDTTLHESRTGKRPLPIPEGVKIEQDGDYVTVKGPKGEFRRRIPRGAALEIEDNTLRVRLLTEYGREGVQSQGLARALLRNMVEGVSKGYSTSLDLVGVGYRAELNGDELKMALGLSHSVVVKVPKDIECKVEVIDVSGQKRPRVHLSSHDKEKLGQTAAHIRSLRPPEPYKGKGVRYTGERVREKAGKAGGKK